MSTTITATDFNFPNQKSVYHGKVRDVYNINDEFLVMIATARISAAAKRKTFVWCADNDAWVIPALSEPLALA
jgi:ABC-type sugar transport system substrate-binding protein